MRRCAYDSRIPDAGCPERGHPRQAADPVPACRPDRTTTACPASRTHARAGAREQAGEDARGLACADHHRFGTTNGAKTAPEGSEDA